MRDIPQAKCVLFDAPAMTRGRSPVPGSLFLPTRISRFLQKKGCTLTKENRYSCDTKPWVRKDPTASAEVEFVAEVERFNILVNQAFESTHGGKTVQGRAFDFDAYIKGHKSLQDMGTVKAQPNPVKHLKSKTEAAAMLSHVPVKADLHKDDDSKKASPFESVYAQDDGDMISVDDIMRMADARGAALLDEPRENGETMRSEGAVITMDITYDNAKSFDFLGNTNATYTITASYLPMKYYRITYDTLLKGGEERTVSNVYGLLILMNVNGKIRTFSISYMLTYLTTAMVSLALATTLTDYIMQYAMGAMSPRFSLLKFQTSMKFGKFAANEAAVKNLYGKDYNPVTNKAVAHGDLLNNKAEEYMKGGDAAPIDKKDLLCILLKFDQRLNRLDACDETNAGDGEEKIGETKDTQRDQGCVLVDNWEDDYNERVFKVPKPKPQE